jgi:ABC-type phosphate/phosphonate transport system substrate-binding protein
MSWKMALPMYNASPRLRAGYDELLAALMEQAGLEGVGEHVRAPALPDFWQRADLLFSQTCGYPYLHLLAGRATLVATPCYDVPGCSGSDYASAIVVRADGAIRTLADARGCVAAANDTHSNSGMNARRHAVAPLAQGGRFFKRVTWSGSHAASLSLVRDGAADVAAIDCVTYAYLSEENPAAVAGLTVLDWSARAPGLPLNAGRAVPGTWVRRLRAALLAPNPQLQAALGPLRIAGFRHVDDAGYARVGRMEEEARALGYPELG